MAHTFLATPYKERKWSTAEGDLLGDLSLLELFGDVPANDLVGTGAAASAGAGAQQRSGRARVWIFFMASPQCCVCREVYLSP